MSNNGCAAADANAANARKRKRVTCGGAMSNKKRQLQLHLVRGSLLPAADADMAGRFPVMEAEVWSRLPEELIWEVLRFVPAAYYFRLQLVSRQWRQRLTSGDLRSRAVQPPVVACATSGGPFARGDHSSHSSKKVVVDIDLASIVPSSFWKSNDDSNPHKVVEAADGLVCISSNLVEGDDTGRKRASNYCVLNPVTRTCKVLPEVPLDGWAWLPPTPTALTVYGFMKGTGTDDSGYDIHWHGQLHFATYDLTAGGSGRWELAAACKPGEGRDQWMAPVVVVCAGETVWLFQRRVHVLVVPRPGQGPAVEVAQLEHPSLEMLGLLGLDASRCKSRSRLLVAHRGVVYFLMSMYVEMSRGLDVVMGVWRLAREGLQWEVVAGLDVADVVRLTGLKRSDLVWTEFGRVQLEGASGVREFLYCTVLVGKREWRRLVLGLNLDTGEWQVVHDGQGLFYDGDYYQSPSSDPSVCKDVSRPLELRPDLFV